MEALDNKLLRKTIISTDNRPTDGRTCKTTMGSSF